MAGFKKDSYPEKIDARESRPGSSLIYDSPMRLSLAISLQSIHKFYFHTLSHNPLLNKHPPAMSANDGSAAVPVDPLARTYLANATAPRINTDLALRAQIEAAYPGQHITVCPEPGFDVLGFAARTGRAIVTPDPDGNGTTRGPIETVRYYPPRSRIAAAATSPCGGEGGDAGGEAAQGALDTEVQFGRYRVGFGGAEMVLYLVDGRDGDSSYPSVRNYYIVSDRAEHAQALLLATGSYWSRLHSEIWVFDQGYWSKDRELWESMTKARWEDVILDAGMKQSIIGDVERFFDGREAYERLAIPWKRGIILHGPPGNGKTISIKATMHMLYGRATEIPTLYVKTLSSYVHACIEVTGLTFQVRRAGIQFECHFYQGSSGSTMPVDSGRP
jgi:transitional endoplasmic reticulum ATPase